MMFLTHILSFTSTKEAVQTCILAKRWRNIWASVPVLDFNLDDFYKENDDQEEDENRNRNRNSCGGGGDNDDNEEEEEDDCQRFVRFVNGVLENRGPSHMDSVRYNWIYDSSDDPSLDILDRLTHLMPRVIIASIDSVISMLVPDSVFLCASLQELIMHLYYSDTLKYFLAPKSINLPSLKNLELTGVEISDNFARNLFSGCPALERIKLDRCFLHVPVISSSVLKMVTLINCHLFRSLQISCPALVSLMIDDIVLLGASMSLLNMTSLVNADITSLDFDCSSHPPPLNLLSGLSNATSLKLCFRIHEFKEQLEEDIPNCRIFNNLKSLEIRARDMRNFLGLVACFLKNSPNLQELTLEHSRVIPCDEPIQAVAVDHLFIDEYLETLKIICANKESAGSLVKLLMRYIKTIGKIIVDSKGYYC